MLDFLILFGLAAIGSYVEDPSSSYSSSVTAASWPYDRVTQDYNVPTRAPPPIRPHPDYPQRSTLACYFDATDVTNRYPMVLDIDRIPAEKCTQLVYSSAIVDERTYRLRAYNPDFDIQKGGYRKAVGLKRRNPELKVLLAIGEFVDETKEHRYTDLIRSDSRRNQFVQDIFQFVSQYDFDGVNIFWYSYETVEESAESCMVKLVKELKRVFQPHGYLLTITIPGDADIIKENYDIEALDRYVDYIYIAAYDFEAADGRLAYPHGAMYYIPYTGYPKIKEKNVDYVTKLVQSKIQLSGVILGIPTYGAAYYLKNPSQHDIYAPVDDRNKPSGPYTRTPGIFAYYEICPGLNNGTLNHEFHNIAKVPFAYRGRTWIGYEDEDSLRYKVQYLQQKGYAGAAVFSLDLDDFKGVCGERYPLISTIQSSLAHRYI